MLNRFRDRMSEPPGGLWFYRPAPDAVIVKARTFHELEELLRAGPHPLPDNLREAVEDFMCEYLPVGACARAGKHARLSLQSVVTFTDFMARSLMSRFSKGETVYVSEEEAARRAKICASCPLHAPAFCSSCLSLGQKLAASLPAGRRVPEAEKLGACSACGCMLSLKVHFKKELFEPLFSGKKPDYHPSCWMHNDD